ncbi:MAG: hypothetical protein COA38_17220 [Fluviicola sp.]|nr:MAG: hypothetical protein COA38_17220 [Fluviicola sp.]
MKLLLLILAIPLISFVSYDIDYTVMPANSIAVIANGSTELQLLETVKAKFSSGSNLSKLSFKGTETSVQFKKGTPLVFFTRGGTNREPMTFAIVKLEVGEKKRTATYNSITGKEIETAPCYVKPLDVKNQIYRVTSNSELEVGVYALIFKSVSLGNFRMTMGARLRANPTVIEIVE